MLVFLRLTLRHDKKFVNLIADIAARKHEIVHDIEQKKKMVPFVMSESALGQNASNLVSGVNLFELDLRVKTGPVKQPIECNSVDSGYVSHRRTSAFDDHLASKIQSNALWRQFFAFGVT